MDASCARWDNEEGEGVEIKDNGGFVFEDISIRQAAIKNHLSSIPEYTFVSI
jgi:hypothetical protein